MVVKTPCPISLLATTRVTAPSAPMRIQASKGLGVARFAGSWASASERSRTPTTSAVPAAADACRKRRRDSPAGALTRHLPWARRRSRPGVAGGAVDRLAHPLVGAAAAEVAAERAVDVGVGRVRRASPAARPRSSAAPTGSSRTGAPAPRSRPSAAGGCGPAERPSMVVIRLPATSPTAVTQERVASPSTCTVQAPHSAMPQPYLVPVRPSTSRSTQSSGISGSTSTRGGSPLTVKAMGTMGDPPRLENSPPSVRQDEPVGSPQEDPPAPRAGCRSGPAGEGAAGSPARA